MTDYKKTFRVPVSLTLSGFLLIEADSAEDAEARVYEEGINPMRILEVEEDVSVDDGTEQVQPSEEEIRIWMTSHAAEYIDEETGDIDATLLVEGWDNEVMDGETTLDEDHVAWVIAAAVVDEYSPACED